MHDWNVIVSVREGGYNRARQVLQKYGPVQRTDYFNVLTMKVDDPRAFVEALRDRIVEKPELLHVLARVVPATQTFFFASPEEFEKQAREVALGWVPELGEKSFHVRMHRRGFRGQLATPEEERFLDGALLATLEKAGTPGRITFDDPDVILAVETLDNRAGLSLWTRADLQRYPFLGLD